MTSALEVDALVKEIIDKSTTLSQPEISMKQMTFTTWGTTRFFPTF